MLKTGFDRFRLLEISSDKHEHDYKHAYKHDLEEEFTYSTMNHHCFMGPGSEMRILCLHVICWDVALYPLFWHGWSATYLKQSRIEKGQG